jgi:D-arabinose 1-dehydrogenase-like Zn-dependent alcohol dehydrogenase
MFEPLLRIGSPAEIEEMFEVAVKHGVKPWVTTYPMDKAGEAVTAMHEGKARYRFVLVPK